MATLPYSVDFRTSSRKRKDGTTWKSKNYFIRYRHNGKLIYTDLETDNKAEADKKALDIYAEETKDQRPAYSTKSLKNYLKKNNFFSETENPIYKEYRDEISNYRMGYYSSKRNTAIFKFVFEKQKDEIGDINYMKITKKDAKAFKERMIKAKDSRGNPLKPSKVNRILAAFSVAFDYLIKTESLDIKNPFSKKELDRMREKTLTEKFVFQPKEIKRLLDDELLKMCYDVSAVIQESAHCVRHYDYDWWFNFINSSQYKMLSLMALSGLRSNEAAALTKGQFDKEHFRIVKINNAFKIAPNAAQMKAYLDGDKSLKIFGLPKNGEERTIVLCDKAFYIVKPLLDACQNDDDLIFVSKNEEGKYHNLHHLYYIGLKHNYRAFLKMFCDKFKIKVPENEKVSAHCLRTTLNTNLLKDPDVSVKESWIASYMGWKSKTLTRTQGASYTHYDIPQYRAVANAINLLYTGQEMLWNTFVKEQRDDNIDLIEAQIRKRNQGRYELITIRGFLYEAFNIIAALGEMGIPGRNARNTMRHFILRAKGFEKIEDLDELKEKVNGSLLQLRFAKHITEDGLFEEESARLMEIEEQLEKLVEKRGA